MGEAISKLLGGKTSEEVEQQLEFLVKTCTEKLDRYQLELENAFSDKSIIQRRSVPGNRAIRWVREYTVGVSQDTSKNVSEAIDSFFGAVTTEGDERKKNIVNGFKKVVQGALSTFLGNIQIGEHEEEKFFVFLQHNAIIRIDVRLWRYNFKNEKVMANSKNALCYIICSSVVDRAALTFDEMIYFLSEHAGDTDVESYIDELARIWHKMEILPVKYGSNPQKGPIVQNFPAARKVTTLQAPPAPPTNPPGVVLGGETSGGAPSGGETSGGAPVVTTAGQGGEAEA